MGIIFFHIFQNGAKNQDGFSLFHLEEFISYNLDFNGSWLKKTGLFYDFVILRI
jgi:hypothetical protein